MASASNNAAKSNSKIKAQPITAREIQMLKQKLISDQERILGNFEEKKIMGGQANYTETKDEVDSANEDILLSTTLRFSNRENFYLKKIKKALMKIDHNEYGICEECGENISFARLTARPTSEMCINCKEESERAEHQNIHMRGSKSIGKKIDLVTSLP
ncbi:MAG: TraR/DksA family transcriptional regulator [Bacteriovoracaceae bacterium]|nr:TraR/DksA family transcriptional regulator [Bacteriovoracaceae bacterium]